MAPTTSGNWCNFLRESQVTSDSAVANWVADGDLYMSAVSWTQSSTSPPMEVNPQDLLDSADQVERHVQKLKTEHEAAHTQMEAAQAGWAGRSAVALQSLVRKWRAGTDAMTSDLAGHAAALRAAGLAYQDTDARVAENVTQAGATLDAFGAER